MLHNTCCHFKYLYFISFDPQNNQNVNLNFCRPRKRETFISFILRPGLIMAPRTLYSWCCFRDVLYGTLLRVYNLGLWLCTAGMDKFGLITIFWMFDINLGENNFWTTFWFCFFEDILILYFYCSAGVGRTGTYIALDALLQFGKRSGNVDIPRYIYTMRKDRMHMIQTPVC